VWKTTGKDSSEACAIACQNCAVYSVFPSGITSHSKIAQFNWECIAPCRLICKGHMVYDPMGNLLLCWRVVKILMATVWNVVWEECLELDYVLCLYNGREFVTVLLTLLSTPFQWEHNCHLLWKLCVWILMEGIPLSFNSQNKIIWFIPSN